MSSAGRSQGIRPGDSMREQVSWDGHRSPRGFATSVRRGVRAGRRGNLDEAAAHRGAVNREEVTALAWPRGPTEALGPRYPHLWHKQLRERYAVTALGKVLSPPGTPHPRPRPPPTRPRTPQRDHHVGHRGRSPHTGPPHHPPRWPQPRPPDHHRRLHRPALGRTGRPHPPRLQPPTSHPHRPVRLRQPPRSQRPPQLRPPQNRLLRPHRHPSRPYSTPSSNKTPPPINAPTCSPPPTGNCCAAPP